MLYGSTRTLFTRTSKLPPFTSTIPETSRSRSSRKGNQDGCHKPSSPHASLRSLPPNGKSVFTMMSLHINNHHAKKRGIGKKLLLTVRTVLLQEYVDLVAGDFNGAAWRRPSGNDRRLTSIIEEAFANTDLPMPPGSTPWWGPGSVPGEWADVCGFLKPTCCEPEWQVRMHGAFTIPYGTLGLREKRSKLPP